MSQIELRSDPAAGALPGRSGLRSADAAWFAHVFISGAYFDSTLHSDEVRQMIGPGLGKFVAASALIVALSCQTSGFGSNPSTSSTPLAPISIALNRGSLPASIAIGFGSVWVGSHGSHTLYRIDPTSNTVMAQIDAGRVICYLGVGLERVWLGDCFQDSSVLVVDPITNRVVGSFKRNTTSFVFAAGSAWVPSYADDQLARIDPANYRTIASIKVAPTNFAISGGGFIWVPEGKIPRSPGPSFTGTIFKVDPNTNQVVTTLHTISSKNSDYEPQFTFAFGAIWMKDYNDSNLVRIDPETGSARILTLPARLPFTGYYDVNLVADSTSLWLRTATGVVSRVDPKTGRVLGTYPADTYGGGGLIALGFDSLWMTNFSSDTVWRDQIPGLRVQD